MSSAFLRVTMSTHFLRINHLPASRRWCVSTGQYPRTGTAGIDDATPDPVGGQFKRDDNGQLTGMYSVAMDSFRAVLPSETDAPQGEPAPYMAVNASMG